MIRETESEPSGEELIALIGALRAENASLKARIAELERRLGLNSLEQRQASVERWTEEADTGEEPAGRVRQAAGRAEGSHGRDPATGQAEWETTLLPPSWYVLYQLSRLDNQTFQRMLDAGEISADMERVARVLERSRPIGEACFGFVSRLSFAIAISI